MKSWEYKFVDIKPPSAQIDSEKEFERLGKEGWELTATYTITEGDRPNSVAVFKKELE